jgi:nicotinamidase-related amidase
MTKTLLEMAGAPSTPASFDDAVLVLIDCQNEYRDGALPLTGIGAAIGEAERLLSAARAAAAPIVHIAHKGRAGSLFDRAAAGGAIVDELAPQAGEPVIEKQLPNAFAGTDLAAHVEQTGRKQLVVAGFMTHMCVSSTVRAALDLGLFSTVVGAACATRDLPLPGGGTLAAEQLHQAELAALADRFAIVVERASELS